MDQTNDLSAQKIPDAHMDVDDVIRSFMENFIEGTGKCFRAESREFETFICDTHNALWPDDSVDVSHFYPEPCCPYVNGFVFKLKRSFWETFNDLDEVSGVCGEAISEWTGDKFPSNSSVTQGVRKEIH